MCNKNELLDLAQLNLFTVITARIQYLTFHMHSIWRHVLYRYWLSRYFLNSFEPRKCYFILNQEMLTFLWKFKFFNYSLGSAYEGSHFSGALYDLHLDRTFRRRLG